MTCNARRHRHFGTQTHREAAFIGTTPDLAREPMQQIQRAIFDLRRGAPIVVRGEASDMLVAPVEYLDDASLDALTDLAGSAASLVLTYYRLSYLQPDCPDGPGRLALQPDERAASILSYAIDAQAQWPTPRPIEPIDDIETAALALAHRARLIPAVVVAVVAPDNTAALARRLADYSMLAVPAVDVQQSRNDADIRRVSDARVPLPEAADSRLVVFREANGLAEHIAVLIGDPQHWPDAVPVRMHSACLTGDLFGSLRCDCGAQLKASVKQIAALGGGALLYLDQEGRGIGLANKMRAYHLQDTGLDTVDADQVLGFGPDGRDYGVALSMLRALDISRVELLTNNPSKYQALSAGGIDVVRRHGVYGQLTPDNADYLQTKADRAGHWLGTLINNDSAQSSTGSD